MKQVFQSNGFLLSLCEMNKIIFFCLELNQQVSLCDVDDFKVTRTSLRNKEQNKVNTFYDPDNYCNECKIPFLTAEEYNLHRSGHDNNLKCSLCTTVLKSFKNYDKHIAKCKPYKCNVCQKVRIKFY